MLQAIGVSAAVVAIAEIGDKTQLLAIILATRFKAPLPIIAGILVATLANHALAALAGYWVSGLMSGVWFKYAVAIAFIAAVLVFSQGLPEKIAFAHIDMNNAPAEIGALEAIEDRLVPGAVIVLDDFGALPYRAQHVAETEWFAKRGVPVLELPTSQGLVIW